MQAASPVNTKTVTGRRPLDFKTVDDALAEPERLAQAEREGHSRGLGNWTVGQTLEHLGMWADYAFDGTPLKVPFLMRLALRPMKRRFLYKKMPSGARIPKVPGGTLAIEPASLDDGLAHLRKSFTRLRDQAPTAPHIFFGPLTHDEWINMHLRHAELHLSFICPE